MFNRLKSFICKLFNIKACQCEDEHIEFFTKVPEPDVPVHKPTHCGSHTKFMKSMCHQCLAVTT